MSPLEESLACALVLTRSALSQALKGNPIPAVLASARAATDDALAMYEAQREEEMALEVGAVGETGVGGAL